MHKPEHAPRLLIVDDNPTDASLLKVALRNQGRTEFIHVVDDGAKALDFLKRDNPQPDLIIMDLNMPRRSGHEVLAVIKQDAELRSIPVIMFTSSENEADVRKAYEAHVNCFVTKPSDYATWARVVAAIENFWLETATLPRRSAVAPSKGMSELYTDLERTRHEFMEAVLAICSKLADEISAELALQHCAAAGGTSARAEQNYATIESLLAGMEISTERSAFETRSNELRNRLDLLRRQLAAVAKS